jgi:2-keto-4-pentenoate hydratase/2-oxohepta-3-ene-1,7-dioic acid hydratase in catechol pathway
MKLASFTHRGQAGYGPVVEGGVVDAARRLGTAAPTLRRALEDGGLPSLRALAGLPADYGMTEIEFALPIPEPSKIICVGRNYRGHVAEGNLKLPEKPSVFIRTLESFVPHGGAMIRPRASSDYDYEGELCVVIGKTGRHITREDALDHVAGYTCMNEACLRDFQFNHSLTVGKNFFHSGSIGPWMVTADEIPAPSKLMLRTRLNGVEVQHSPTDDLIFDIPEIIRYLSVLLPLNPGDIIATGTPEGVGFARTPPLWMKAGDEVEVEISGIGVLRNRVVDEG